MKLRDGERENEGEKGRENEGERGRENNGERQRQREGDDGGEMFHYKSLRVGATRL